MYSSQDTPNPARPLARQYLMRARQAPTNCGKPFSMRIHRTRHRTWWWPTVWFILALAFFLRLHNLPERPLHTDEAVQALKFGELLEDGMYRYDPHEYHGPTLYYFTLPVAWLSGHGDMAGCSESTLRLVPLIWGMLFLLLFTGFRRACGPEGVIGALVLASLSPPVVYYSRYYIQEMLLCTFTLGLIYSGWRYFRSGDRSWAVVAGVFLGLMHATKETFVISLFAIAVALLAVWLLRFPDFRWRWKHIGLAALVAAAVSMLFFSSFLTWPRGVIDSVATYFSYSERAGGEGHEKPFTYYLALLFGHRNQGFFWGELILTLLALAGLVFGWFRNANWTVFLGVMTLVLFLVYSLIPYKTPWLLLNILLPMFFLAGFTVQALMSPALSNSARVIVAILLAGLVYLYGFQSTNANGWWDISAADDRNPYAYSHTVPGHHKLLDYLENLDELVGGKRDLAIRVLGPNYWPLPWDLRRWSNVRYLAEFPEELVTEVVIVDAEFSEQAEAALDRPRDTDGDGSADTGAPYFASAYGLRPNVSLWVYVHPDIRTAFIEANEAPSQ